MVPNQRWGSQAKSLWRPPFDHSHRNWIRPPLPAWSRDAYRGYRLGLCAMQGSWLSDSHSLKKLLHCSPTRIIDLGFLVKPWDCKATVGILSRDSGFIEQTEHTSLQSFSEQSWIHGFKIKASASIMFVGIHLKTQWSWHCSWIKRTSKVVLNSSQLGMLSDWQGHISCGSLWW